MLHFGRLLALLTNITNPENPYYPVDDIVFITLILFIAIFKLASSLEAYFLPNLSVYDDNLFILKHASPNVRPIGIHYGWLLAIHTNIGLA